MALPSRRDLGFLAVAMLLQGCGWRPVYGPGDNGTVGPAEMGLGETEVLLIPERFGQLMRESLRGRFERGRSSTVRRYDLQVSLGLSAEGIGIQRDNATSRTRLIGTASWTLLAQNSQRSTLASGVAREVDAYNVINQQYFATDLQSEAVQRRMADTLAEKVTLQLAAWFRQRAAAG